MHDLTDAQRTLLDAISKSELADRFYLSGGTALAAFYLHHRHSDDLDLFTRDRFESRTVLEVVEAIAEGPVVPVRREHRFGLLVPLRGETVRVEFVQYDHPFVEPPLPTLGALRVDGLRDILANKLSAMVDRSEAKDFADVYFLLERQRMSLEQGIADATAKFGWPAMHLLLQSAFLKIEGMTAWPVLSPPVAIEEARTAFRRWAKSLIRLDDE
jgi:predicted nucleotidyltransferase component of viral defense system